MKMVSKSKKPSFIGQNSETGAIRQNKKIAMGSQTQTSVTKVPGLRGSRKPGMKTS